MYMRNFEPTRWPASNPETGYLNTDGGATKTEILNAHRKDSGDYNWALCFGRREAEELYNLKDDPDCLKNLAVSAEHRARKEKLKQQLFNELKAQEDPRMFGKGGVFEAEPYAHPGQRDFYRRYMSGEQMKAGWVSDTDFEKKPLD
jgi:hypothetical protein